MNSKRKIKQAMYTKGWHALFHFLARRVVKDFQRTAKFTANIIRQNDRINLIENYSTNSLGGPNRFTCRQANIPQNSPLKLPITVASCKPLSRA